MSGRQIAVQAEHVERNTEQFETGAGQARDFLEKRSRPEWFDELMRLETMRKWARSELAGKKTDSPGWFKDLMSDGRGREWARGFLDEQAQAKKKNGAGLLFKAAGLLEQVESFSKRSFLDVTVVTFFKTLSSAMKATSEALEKHALSRSEDRKVREELLPRIKALTASLDKTLLLAGEKPALEDRSLGEPVSEAQMLYVKLARDQEAERKFLLANFPGRSWDKQAQMWRVPFDKSNLRNDRLMEMELFADREGKTPLNDRQKSELLGRPLKKREQVKGQERAKSFGR